MTIKNLIYTSFFLFLLIFTNSNAQETPIVDSIDQNENLLDSNEAYKQQFDSLSRDGDWIKVKKADFVNEVSEGTGEDLDEYENDYEEFYFWRPHCSNSYWNPYTDGRWVFTRYGWIWLSDYRWGWGPYNYGRWFYSNYYGWVWLPGRIWAANWVTWRWWGGFFGWYPVCPRIRWRAHHGGWCHNHLYTYVPTNWVFVHQKDFTKKVTKYTVVDANQNQDILKDSKKVKTAVYVDPGKPNFKYSGPDVKVISKESGEKITPKEVVLTNTKENRNDDETRVSVYQNTGTTNAKDTKVNVTTDREDKDIDIKKIDDQEKSTEVKKENPKVTNSESKNTSTYKQKKKVRYKQSDGSDKENNTKGSSDNGSKKDNTKGNNNNGSKKDNTKGSSDGNKSNSNEKQTGTTETKTNSGNDMDIKTNDTDKKD